MSAAFEVRITPLLMPVAGEDEAFPEGVEPIPEVDTTVVEQFADVEVSMAINEGRTGRVTLSMHDPIVQDLAPFQQAVWIGFKRPDEELAECVLWGQANVTEDFDAETITLEIADPVFKAQHHYIGRHDVRINGAPPEDLLNIDLHRGALAMHAWSISDVINAARNLPEQQDRGVPVLGLAELMMSDFGGTPAYATADEPERRFEFERGQEVWALIKQIITDINGPDADLPPYFAYTFPLTYAYAALACYDPPTDPESPGAAELGRNLDPADPDAPAEGDVIFELGQGVDNLVNVTVTPERPTTHCHVVDRDKVYRETSADAEASADTGIFVDWIEVDYALPLPPPNSTAGRFRGGPAVDTSLLRARADVQIKMLGRPPKQFTCTMRPSDALTYQFGHPDWAAITGGEGGHWYLGDYVRVRATRGYRAFTTLARVTGAKLFAQGWNGLPMIEAAMIPAIGGTPGDSEEEDVDLAAPTVALTAPAGGATVSGSSVSVTATASDDIAVANVTFYLDGVAMGSGDISDPYGLTWNTTGTTDGSHTLVAVATDTSGKQTSSAPVTVTVDNAAAPPPGDPPPVGTNLLYTDGRVIRKVSDDSAVSLRMLNVHTGGFAWSQEVFDDIAAEGFNGVRLLVNWKRIETSAGVFSSTELGYVQTAIDRCTNAGLYVVLCAGVNSPQWSQRSSYLPSWSYDSDGPSTPETGWDRPTLFSVMVSNGEAYARKLVQEFGADPNVVAFDWWNEPDEATASLVQQGMEIMIGWGRDEANGAGKCWLVTNRYSSQSAANAFNDWDQHDWSHGDLWLQPHAYYAPSSPTDTGWSSSDGMRKSSDGTFWNGGPEATTYSTANKAAMRNHLATWKQIGQERNCPVVLGELGVQWWKATATVRDNWMRDMVEAAELEEFAGVAGWIYGNDSDDWALKRAGTWRAEAARIASFTSTLV